MLGDEFSSVGRHASVFILFDDEEFVIDNAVSIDSPGSALREYTGLRGVDSGEWTPGVHTVPDQYWYLFSKENVLLQLGSLLY